VAKERLPPVPRQPIRAIDPVCAECGSVAKSISGAEMWGDSAHDKHATFFKCECGAWAASIRGSDIPQGFPAGRELRDIRQRGQTEFERIWQAKMRLQNLGKGRAKHAGITWLCEQLGIEPCDCWFGHFDHNRARQALALCAPIAARMTELELEAMRRRREAETLQEAF